MDHKRPASAPKGARLHAAKPATIRDVARLSGVSTATVSRSFSGKADAISPKTLESVRNAARVLGYTPSEIGRSLRLARSRVVVMLVPDTTNHFTIDIAASVEAALNGVGLSMVIANTREDGDQQDRILADAEGLRARAVILQGAIDTPFLRDVAARRGNLIFVNRRPVDGMTAPYVGVDNFAAGFAVGRHFAQRGYADCVVLHAPPQVSGASERLQGFLAGLGEGTPVRQVESTFTMEAGYAEAQRLVADRTSRLAIFCANDMVAYGVHRAAVEAGLRVPEDLAIFGFDDNRLNDWLAPWLTTVKVPASDFGPAIVDLIETPSASRDRSVILPFSLKIRQSA